MSIHNIIGSEAFHRGSYAPGFGSITLTRPSQSGRLLRRIVLLALALTACAIFAGVAQGMG